MDKESLQTRPAPLLALVVPCYNEQETLPATFRALASLLADLKARGLIKKESFACYVDDGSKDETWRLLAERSETDPYCRAVKFAGNAGHQNAVWAGMDIACGWGVDCIISMDADLQDDISVAGRMIEDYMQGSEVVYGVRGNRPSDTVFKRETARLFYALMSKLDLGVIPEHADYRLVSRPVLNILKGFGERNLFLRGLFPAIGFKSSKVYYSRKNRELGESKYPLKKMISFAWQGVTSCSAAPLRIAGLLSLACMFIAILICIASFYKYWMGETIQGWTSLIIVCLFLGSIQLFCLAVIGEYIAKIFIEVRKRPRYIIEEVLPHSAARSEGGENGGRP